MIIFKMDNLSPCTLINFVIPEKIAQSAYILINYLLLFLSVPFSLLMPPSDRRVIDWRYSRVVLLFQEPDETAV